MDTVVKTRCARTAPRVVWTTTSARPRLRSCEDGTSSPGAGPTGSRRLRPRPILVRRSKCYGGGMPLCSGLNGQFDAVFAWNAGAQTYVVYYPQVPPQVTRRQVPPQVNTLQELQSDQAIYVHPAIPERVQLRTSEGVWIRVDRAVEWDQAIEPMVSPDDSPLRGRGFEEGEKASLGRGSAQGDGSVQQDVDVRRGVSGGRADAPER